LDFLIETRWNTAKATWRSQHRWREPAAEVWTSIEGEIDARAADRLIAVIDAARAAPLCIAVDSNGGNPVEALRIYQALRSRSGPVETCVSNRCFSAAVCAFLGGDIRTAAPGATFLIHGSAYEGATPFRATVGALRASAAELAAIDEEVLAVLTWRTRLPKWQARNALDNERTFDSTEAWHSGLLTAVPR
jgi:ATP-dependent protease ClpP protease subunit